MPGRPRTAPGWSHCPGGPGTPTTSRTGATRRGRRAGPSHPGTNRPATCWASRRPPGRGAPTARRPGRRRPTTPSRCGSARAGPTGRRRTRTSARGPAVGGGVTPARNTGAARSSGSGTQARGGRGSRAVPDQRAGASDPRGPERRTRDAGRSAGTTRHRGEGARPEPSRPEPSRPESSRTDPGRDDGGRPRPATRRGRARGRRTHPIVPSWEDVLLGCAPRAPEPRSESALPGGHPARPPPASEHQREPIPTKAPHTAHRQVGHVAVEPQRRHEPGDDHQVDEQPDSRARPPSAAARVRFTSSTSPATSAPGSARRPRGGLGERPSSVRARGPAASPRRRVGSGHRRHARCTGA